MLGRIRRARARVPVLVIRGENSDILSAETVIKMKAGKHHPAMEVIEVPDEWACPAACR